jgi:hypothetical protein
MRPARSEGRESLPQKEVTLACPICQKRKAKRYCPAKAENICSICCGTEREVTIDCPAYCPHLIASRQYEDTRREIDWESLPFPDVEIDPSSMENHGLLLASLNRVICEYARQNPALVDTDINTVLQVLAEAYQRLANGLYYEQPPAYPLQRGLYDALEKAFTDFRKAEAENAGLIAMRDSEIRDALIFLARLGATRTNGRPKGRAFLDLLWGKLPPEERGRRQPGLILLP